ncbi:Mov34/MPN/PAD-1 family protein [Paenibacillus xylanexedens]|uniref:Integrative and conjugative element protein (TIGR02256 family) n=1 Tax=Paenibacillus xylanexedens TaxID=528191 RepID=A0ABS4S4E7_PAEXY|nr:Mov34/MPN/PAD-1 family protein [Paenibacillus xylanexedens]MBP2248942.1 integrative and conjugative element protein (TIGR02256 family) [Paenibacillus xylanexedens]
MLSYIFEDYDVQISQSVEEIFNIYRQNDKWKSESGGILLGRVYRNKIIIEMASEPNGSDKSGRYYFYRNVRRAQKIVEQSWKDSGGEIVYLGEWHTHPEEVPTPSCTDKRLIINMLRDTNMEIDFLFLIIVGISNYYVAVQKKGDVLKSLFVRNVD